jgi:hypothetical protein
MAEFASIPRRPEFSRIPLHHVGSSDLSRIPRRDEKSAETEFSRIPLPVLQSAANPHRRQNRPAAQQSVAGVLTKFNIPPRKW